GAPAAVVVRTQPGALAHLRAVNPHQRMEAVPAPRYERQQPARMAGVVLGNVAGAPGSVIEQMVDLLPLLDRNDRGPVRLADHLALVHPQSRDRRALDDLPY